MSLMGKEGPLFKKKKKEEEEEEEGGPAVQEQGGKGVGAGLLAAYPPSQVRLRN
jgi:hypothetical protein